MVSEAPQLPPQPPVDGAETRKYQDVKADQEARQKELKGEAYNLPADYEAENGEPTFRVQYKIQYTREDGSSYDRTSLGEGTDLIVSEELLKKLRGLQDGQIVPTGEGYPTLFEGCVVSKSINALRDAQAPGTRMVYIGNISADPFHTTNNPTK